MRKHRRHALGVGVTALAAAALVVGATGTSVLAQDTVLRISMGSPGEAGIRVWDQIAADFEVANPGVDVQMDYQDDDLYETVLGILALGDRQRLRLFMRRDPFERFVSCLLFVPRENYATELRVRCERYRHMQPARIYAAGESFKPR